MLLADPRTMREVLMHVMLTCIGSHQVNFFDDTEVLLWADKPWVTYKGKTKQRNTYNLHDITSFQELSKRLKYTKDILSQLITTH